MTNTLGILAVKPVWILILATLTIGCVSTHTMHPSGLSSDTRLPKTIRITLMDDGEPVVLKDAYVSDGAIVGTDTDGGSKVVALSSIQTVEAKSSRAWVPVLAVTIGVTAIVLALITPQPLLW